LISELELMRIHLEAEFTHDSTGRMRSVNEPGGSDAPKFFLGRTAEGNMWRLRHDVGADLVQALEALCKREPVGKDITLPRDSAAAYTRLLAQRAPIQNLWTGPAFRFPDEVPTAPETVLVTEANADVLHPHFKEWLDDIAHAQPFLALLVGGRAVSICCSVRITGEAHEAGVETFHEVRGCGHAAQVVAAWANAVRQIGPIPLYSTSWRNTASQAVAKKLGLVQYGADLHIT
jgi:hypothetical protein